MDKVHPMYTPIPSHLGKEIEVFDSKYKQRITILEGGLKITTFSPYCGFGCLGWNIAYKVIPKQCIVGVDIRGMFRWKCPCCCCCCPRFDTLVTLDILRKGELITNEPSKQKKKSKWWCSKKTAEDDVSPFDCRDDEDFQYDPTDTTDRFTQKKLSRYRVKPKREKMSFIFAWDEAQIREHGSLLHNYVYGSVASAGCEKDAHSLSHLFAQGLAKEGRCKLQLSKK